MTNEERATLWMIAGAVVNNAVSLRRIEERMFPERFRDGAVVDIGEEAGRIEGATELACATRERFVLDSTLTTMIRREGGLPRL
jgi:hypothetical protein